MIRTTISRKFAARLRGVSTRTIDRWIREGRIEAFKAFRGKKVLIYEDSLSEENLKSAKPKFNNFQ